MAKGKKIRIVFMGTPDFAATILDQLTGWGQGEIVCCYTQPDRPSGRGQKTRESAVKQTALRHGLSVLQPLNFKNEEDINALRALRPDVLLVAAYGLILPQAVLDIAPFGSINVHASLLPLYRGAAPIQRAIQNGDKVTGISIMQMEKGLDTGPVLLQRSLAIAPNEHAGTIHDQLAELGGRLLIETLNSLVVGNLHPPLPQDSKRATYAAKLEKSEGQIDWNLPALTVHNKIRALYPFPGTWFVWNTPSGKELRLHLVPGQIGRQRPPDCAVGTIALENDMLAIACQDFFYLLPAIKPAGKGLQTAKAFYCGYLSQAGGSS